MRKIQNKAVHIVVQIINALILAGILILLMGLYYEVIKAGIPYQDPTPDMLMEYTVNWRVGRVLIRNGFMTAVSSGIIRLVLCFVWKRLEKEDRKI